MYPLIAARCRLDKDTRSIFELGAEPWSSERAGSFRGEGPQIRLEFSRRLLDEFSVRAGETVGPRVESGAASEGANQPQKGGALGLMFQHIPFPSSHPRPCSPPLSSSPAIQSSSDEYGCIFYE